MREYIHTSLILTRLIRLTGDDRTKQTASRLKLESRATDEQGLEMLRELGKLVWSIGFEGLVVLLDEAEAIPSYTSAIKQRHCYENLCRLIGRENRMPHCYFAYATTPLFFSKSDGHVPISEHSNEVFHSVPLAFII